MAQSVKDKTIKGVAWSSIDNIANYGITFIVGIVLARLLSPEEYGLIGIITIFIAIFNTIVDSGFSVALIRKPNADEKDFSTVFYVNLIISLALASLLFFCAPLIARFFERPELIGPTKAMSSVVLINALSIVQKAILTKKIDFKTQTKISVISHVASGVVGTTMAALGYGIWALVFQQISSRTFNTLLLWIYNKWIPRLIFSLESFRQLFAFSWKLLVAQIINTLWSQMYQVVIGKFYKPVTLGQYTRAKQFAEIFSTNMTTVVKRVTFPVLSTMQEDKDRMLNAYRRIIKTTMLIDFVCMLGMVAIAKPLILVLVGEQWLPCVAFLQILCMTFILYPIEVLNINMLTVQGRSNSILFLEILQKCIAVVPLLLGIFINIYWMLIGSMIAGWVNYIIISHFSGSRLGYTTFMQLKDIFPSFIFAVVIATPVWFLSFLPINAFLLLPIQLLTGLLITLILGRISKLQEYVELKKIITEYGSQILRHIHGRN